MDIIISQKSEDPIYEQIYNQVSSQILNGELVADFCLPSIRNIAKELQISVITIKKAWELLEYNGFIYSVAGKGCFVSEIKKENLSDKKNNLAITRLEKDVLFYKGIGLSFDEFVNLAKKVYKEN